jgi:hypothetical protein
MPAFDANLFLTLQHLVGMRWRCCDGSKYGANLVIYSPNCTHSIYCVTLSSSTHVAFAFSSSPLYDDFMRPTAPSIRALISTPLTFHHLHNAPLLLFFSTIEEAKLQSAAP